MSESAQPCDWVRRHLGALPARQPVLDVAAGGGRHTRLARAAGHPVLAVDRDITGLVWCTDDPLTDVVAADLESEPWPLGSRRFGGVIVTNYLHRPLFPALLAALAPGGVLIYETFATGNEAYGRPRNPDFLLRPNELPGLCLPELTVLAFHHGFVERPGPAVRQGIVARRD